MIFIELLQTRGQTNLTTSTRPKKYPVKKKQLGFIDILENGSCAIGQFYILPVKLILKNSRDYVNRGCGYQYGINFYDNDYRLVEHGEVTVPSKIDPHKSAKIMTSGFDGEVFTDMKILSYDDKTEFDELNLSHWENNPEQFWIGNVKQPMVLPLH